LNRHQFFDVAAVRSAWGAHLSGRRNEQSRLWVILMFQSWYEQHHDS
jgi:asparagine synthase (glutamine-hydrolysing)